MTDARYNLVFAGELVPGADIAAVKQNLAKLFKLDAGKVEALFSGKPVTLKKDADQATAMKFRAALRQAGAQCRMEPVVAAGEAEEITPASPPPMESPAPAVAGGDMDMVGTIRTGGTGFSAEFDVAPVGADMADAVEGPAPMVPDVSNISMAPPGADMGQLKKDVEIKVPDISHLSVEPAPEK